MEWLRSLWLGVVQGLTEFLPVSSSGHLVLFQVLTAGPDGLTPEAGSENLFFDVMLHIGTALAILIHYRREALIAVRGLLGSVDVPEGYRRPALLRVGLLVVVATLPLIPDAILFKDYFDRAAQSLRVVGTCFLVTATLMFVTSRLKGGGKDARTMTVPDALLIGLAQAFAPLPGISRSGVTIAAALGLGLSRTWAVGFSLLMAIPAIIGAVAFEVRKIDDLRLTGERIAQIAAASALAGAVGYLAIVWLVRVVRAGRLWYFSVYLIVLGAATLALSTRYPAGGATDGGEARAAERAEAVGPAGPSPGTAAPLPRHGLDRADAGLPRRRAGLPGGPGAGPPSLDLG